MRATQATLTTPSFWIHTTTPEPSLDQSLWDGTAHVSLPPPKPGAPRWKGLYMWGSLLVQNHPAFQDSRRGLALFTCACCEVLLPAFLAAFHVP